MAVSSCAHIRQAHPVCDILSAPLEPVLAGTVLLSRTQEAEAESADEWPHALVMHVAGDTLAGISQLLQGISSVRPMALDLLWQVGNVLSGQHPLVFLEQAWSSNYASVHLVTDAGQRLA